MAPARRTLLQARLALVAILGPTLATGVGRAQVGGEPLAASDSASSVRTAPSAGDLGPTTAAPWNPPHPIPSRRAWEQVLLFPGRVVSLPFMALGYAADRSLLFMENRGMLYNPAFFHDVAGLERGSSRVPVTFKFTRLGDPNGIGGKLGLSQPIIGGAFRTHLEADFSANTRDYNSTLLGVAGHPGDTKYGYDWRPRERFYGIGLESPRGARSSYAVQDEFVRSTFRWGWNRGDGDTAPPRTMVLLWAGPRNLVTRTGRESGRPSYEAVFPELAATTLNRRIEHLIYGGSFSSDWRQGQPHWSSGWRVLLSAERYDRPIKSLALRVGKPLGAQFTRYQVETETGFSFLRDPRTLRFLVRLMNQDITTGAGPFLPSDLATLGGHAGLSGFEPGRFHDLDLLLTRITYVFPLVRRLEVDLHSEWGGVYRNVWGDATLGGLENSVGFALRGRLKQKPVASIGLDFSRETWRIRYKLGGVE